MDFANINDEITYSKLKRLQEASEEAEKKTGERITFWDLIYLFGRQIWYFTESRGKRSIPGRLTIEEKIESEVRRALEIHNYHVEKAGKSIGLNKMKMWRLCRKYNITHYTWKKYK